MTMTNRRDQGYESHFTGQPALRGGLPRPSASQTSLTATRSHRRCDEPLSCAYAPRRRLSVLCKQRGPTLGNLPPSHRRPPVLVDGGSTSESQEAPCRREICKDTK
jgi:hypothetical protein